MKHFKLKHSLVAIGMASGLLACVPACAQGDVTIAVNSALDTLDPYNTNSTLAQAAAKSIYEGLFTFDRSLHIKPVLATGYDVGEDERTYIIHLRTGVTFQDGTRFDAQAVKANLERVMNKANDLAKYNQFSRIREVQALDPSTVKIILKLPFSAFINSLAHPSAVMISPAALKKWGRAIAFHPTGTGPFEFVSWDPSHYLKVKRFPGYWRKGYPKIDTLTFLTETDAEKRAQLLETGKAQLAYPLPYKEVERLKVDDSLRAVAAPSIITRYISMNMLQKPFDDIRVRKAVNYAINKGALAQQGFAGYATPADGVVPQGVRYATKMGIWPYDPAKAKELLKEAGYPNGFSTQLWSRYNDDTSVRVVHALQRELAKIGIKVSVDVLNPNLNLKEVQQAPNPKTAPVRMYYSGWSASTGEADWALRPLFASTSWPPAFNNTAYYSNRKVDDDLRDALLTTDEAKKQKLYTDAQARIWHDAPWAFLVNMQLLSVQSKKLHGFYIMPDGSFMFRNVSLNQ